MDHKCVVIIKEGVPNGFAVNAAAILGVSLGKQKPEIVAEDLTDGSGVTHAGLINVPIPILKGSAEQIKSIYLAAFPNKTIKIIDFSEPARIARTFQDYRDLLSRTEQSELQFVGLALVGLKSEINELTAGLSLFK